MENIFDISDILTDYKKKPKGRKLRSNKAIKDEERQRRLAGGQEPLNHVERHMAGSQSTPFGAKPRRRSGYGTITKTTKGFSVFSSSRGRFG